MTVCLIVHFGRFACAGAILAAVFLAPVFSGPGIAAEGTSAPPDHRAIIRKNLLLAATPAAAKPQDKPSKDAKDESRPAAIDAAKPMFAKLDALGALRISSTARPVFSNFGRGFLACLRVDADAKPQDYAVFIVDGAIVDYRARVITDGCAAQSYEPFSVAVAIAKAASPAKPKQVARSATPQRHAAMRDAPSNDMPRAPPRDATMRDAAPRD